MWAKAIRSCHRVRREGKEGVLDQGERRGRGVGGRGGRWVGGWWVCVGVRREGKGEREEEERRCVCVGRREVCVCVGREGRRVEGGGVGRGVCVERRGRRRGGGLKQTTFYNVSLHPHAKFRSCLLKLDVVCTVSAFSLVQGHKTLNVLLLVGVVFCPNFGRVKFGIFIFAVFMFMLLSSGFSLGDSWRLSSGVSLGDNVPFSGTSCVVIQLSV